MMPIVKAAGYTIKQCYEMEGLGVIEGCMSCNVTINVKREYYLELECAITIGNLNILKNDNIIMTAVQTYTNGYMNSTYRLKMPNEGYETDSGYPEFENLKFLHDPRLQPFRIRSVEVDFNDKKIKIYAKHISKDSDYIVVSKITLSTSTDELYYSICHHVMKNTTWLSTGIFYITADIKSGSYSTYMTNTDRLLTLTDVLELLYPSAQWGIIFDANMMCFYKYSETASIGSIVYGKNMLEARFSDDTSNMYTHVKAFCIKDDVYYESSLKKLNYDSDFQRTKILDYTSIASRYSIMSVKQLDIILDGYVKSSSNIQNPESNDEYKYSGMFEIYNDGNYGNAGIGPGWSATVLFPELGIERKTFVNSYTYDSLVERVSSISFGGDDTDILDTIKLK